MYNITFTSNRNHNICFKNQIKTNANKPKNEKNLLTQNKTIIGAAIASAFIGGGISNIYNNYQDKVLINDMMEEYKLDDTKSLKIEDLNNDKTPEIIIQKNDGIDCVYDFKNNDIYYKVDDEMIKKIR